MNRRNVSSVTTLPLGLTGNYSPFINLVFHIFLITIRYIIGEGRFLSNSGRLYVFFFFISVSLFIDLYAFGFHFVLGLSPLEKGYRGSRISVFVCTCFFLHFWLFVLRVLVFRSLFCNNVIISRFRHDVIVIILFTFDALLKCVLSRFLVLMMVKITNENFLIFLRNITLTILATFVIITLSIIRPWMTRDIRFSGPD